MSSRIWPALAAFTLIGPWAIGLHAQSIDAVVVARELTYWQSGPGSTDHILQEVRLMADIEDVENIQIGNPRAFAAGAPGDSISIPQSGSSDWVLRLEYDNPAEMMEAFPPGEYRIAFTATPSGGTPTEVETEHYLLGESFTLPAPHITNWSDLRMVDLESPVVVQWQSPQFTNQGITSFAVSRVVDGWPQEEIYFEEFFESIGELTIPAGVLTGSQDKVYHVEIGFHHFPVDLDEDGPFGALVASVHSTFTETFINDRQETLPVFGELHHLFDNRYSSPVYGEIDLTFFPVNATTYGEAMGFVYHFEHGWLWAASTGSPGALWWWDFLGTSWYWTNLSYYPNLWSPLSDRGWVYYYVGGNPTQRWFQIVSTGEWLEVP